MPVIRRGLAVSVIMAGLFGQPSGWPHLVAVFPTPLKPVAHAVGSIATVYPFQTRTNHHAKHNPSSSDRATTNPYPTVTLAFSNLEFSYGNTIKETERGEPKGGTTMSAGTSTAPAVKLPYFVADTAGKYRTRRALTEEQIIKAAALLLNRRIERGEVMNSPELVALYLKTRLRGLEHEVFACLFLDNQHRVISYEELFRGTIDGASVFPREVVKLCLGLNAAAVVFAHNHPSGINNPSEADRRITNKLKEALSLIDVRVLDHFIIGDGEPYSFAEHRMI